MGGVSRGNWYRWDKKATVEEFRSIDVRRWQREGYLEPGRRFGWQWTRDSETVASIQVRAEPDRVILSYQHRSDVGEWKRERSILLASTERPAPTAARGPGSAARPEDAGDGWVSCTAA